MKAPMYWSYRPFVPLDEIEKKNFPYICRLAPGRDSICIEILDHIDPEGSHEIKIRPKETCEAWRSELFEGTTVKVEQLNVYTEYEFYVIRAGKEEEKSDLRYAKTGDYPDIIVNYVHPQDPVYSHSGQYLGNPTFVRVPSGALIAAMDVFASNAPQCLELLFRSDDNGKTWRYLCDLFPATWGTLFVHRGLLYMLATSTENGDLIIGVSRDEGCTWEKPVTLFPGGCTARSRGFQRQPMPIVVQNGVLMTSLEFGGWAFPKLYGVGVLSIPENGNLLDPSAWTLSDFTHYQPSWEGSPKGGSIAILEGSIFKAKDGKLIDLLRMQMGSSSPSFGKACLLEIDPENLEKRPSFHSIIDMPTGANSRTHILYDPVSDAYWGIGNLVTDAAHPTMRNVMALVVSTDGYHWKTAKIILDYSRMDSSKVGFQYTSFIFDGDDILYISRTAINGAHNFHDSNCHTFGVVSDFRSLL